jgi:dimethylargininase
MNMVITHAVSPSIQNCVLTFMSRDMIDYQNACKQHSAYCTLLQGLGCKIRKLSDNLSHPDSVFIEDPAIILDELAILANMSAPSRREEPRGIAEELMKYRPLFRIEVPGTLEGGDVARLGRTLVIGRSSRTNDKGIEQLRDIVVPFGYQVLPVNVRKCLHLKTGCSPLTDDTLLFNPAWIDPSELSDFDLIAVDPGEPWAGNAINVNGTVCMHAGFKKTAKILQKRGFNLVFSDISEFQKAEGGLTCLSLRFDM